MRATLVLFVLLVALASCSSDEPDAGDDGTTTTTTTSAVSSTSPAAPSTTSGGSDLPLFHTEPGLALIEVGTPGTGGGPHPLLEWSEVSGAHHYSVSVFTSDGVLVWGWDGSATSVHVGGDPQLDDLAPGPAVEDGMVWGVGAYDDAFLLMATSALHPISP